MSQGSPSPAAHLRAAAVGVVFAVLASVVWAAARAPLQALASTGRVACSIEVAPGADVTATLASALASASRHPDPAVRGPSGRPQGRVHLGPGRYGIRTIVLPDDVRLEISPGATVVGVRGFGASRRNDFGLFQFGTDATAGVGARPSRNVSIVVGDGCGGTGRATRENKPSHTSFRGNRAGEGGMGNAAVPFRSRWRTDAMWVLDLDPAATSVGVEVAGFYFRWAYDIEVSDVMTIQNADRQATGVGPVAGRTSRTVAMMFDPPHDAPFVPDPERQYLPHRVSVSRHYNVLSPSGQGANQVRACRDCRFTDVFSHGGVALRVESDGIRPIGSDCSATGADGQGFREFAIVDGLRAERIEGAYGNRVAMFTPHCLPNGKVTVNSVTGTTMGELVVVAPTERDAPAGGFSRVRITDVWGCGGSRAQEPHPDMDSYLVAPSRAAALVIGPNVRLTGTWRWPSAGRPGGLEDGALPEGQTATVVHDAACP